MNGKPWTEAELALLVKMRVDDRRKWREIEAALGRTISACSLAYYNIRAKAARADFRTRAKAAGEDWPTIPRRRRAKLPTQAPQQAPPAPRSGAPMSTARLVLDAELRSRIALQGITAGLLGDPLPGRSALDQKRSGAA